MTQGLVMGFTNVVSAEQAVSVAVRLGRVVG